MPKFAVIATWPFGRTAVEAALPLLCQGQPALDAAIAGAQAVEDDPAVHSVGYGGLADSAGNVTLDACVMDGQTMNCGAVAGVENICHVAALARRVMERTRHILLVGAGARMFALQQGFVPQNLHTAESVARWYRTRPKPAADLHIQGGTEDHDTVAVLTLDQQGNLGGACSTSGLSHRVPGRVGDSPLIGHGLYVDNTAGAAGATGVGEEVMRMAGSYSIVEAMRAGRSPQEACDLAVRRLNDLAGRRGVHPAHVAFIALDTQGRTGAACTAEMDFHYAVGSEEKVELLQAAAHGSCQSPSAISTCAFQQQSKEE